MPIPMQPPPYYEPFFDATGAIREPWKRFFLAASTSIQFLLNTQQRVGSMQGLMPIEDPADDRFAFVIPGPPGPPGVEAPDVAFGAGFMLGSMETADDSPALVGPPMVEHGPLVGNNPTFLGQWRIRESGVPALTDSATPNRLLLVEANATNWLLGLLNTTYSVIVDNAVQIWQDNAGSLQVVTGGVGFFNLTAAGLLNVLLSVRAHQSTAIPAGGTAGAGYTFSSTANFGIFFGSGAPTLSAAKGSLYLRSDGTTTNDRAYINTDGVTTWTALTTAA